MKKQKNIIIALIVLALVALAAFAFMKPAAPSSEDSAIVAARYTNGIAVVEASYDTKQDTVTFTHPALGTHTLPRALSGSGARYANEDESLVFWEHQDEVTITQSGVEVFKGKKSEEGDAEEVPALSLAGEWVWVKTVMNDGRTIEPKAASAFTVSFVTDGRVSGTTDCNNFSGSFTAGAYGGVAIGPLVSTKKFCKNSQESVFTKALGEANHYLYDGAGNLVLMLPMDSGSMHFRLK